VVPRHAGERAAAFITGYASVPGTHAVALVTNDVWDEAALTWNTRPASGFAGGDVVAASDAPALVSVANAVLQDLPANGLLSLRVYATNSTSDGRVITHRRKRVGRSGRSFPSTTLTRSP